MFKRKSVLPVTTMLAAMLILLSGSVATAGSGVFTEFRCLEVCGAVLEPGTSTPHDGKLHVQGLVRQCTDWASIPQGIGSGQVEINGIWDPNDNLSGPMWGTYHFTNDTGGWLTRWTGETTSEGYRYIRAHGRGIGGYEGMQAWWWMSTDPNDPSYPCVGRILDPHR